MDAKLLTMKVTDLGKMDMLIKVKDGGTIRIQDMGESDTMYAEMIQYTAYDCNKQVTEKKMYIRPNYPRAKVKDIVKDVLEELSMEELDVMTRDVRFMRHAPVMEDMGYDEI